MAALQEGLGHLAGGWKPLDGTIRSVALIRVAPLATLVEHPLRAQAGRR
jgi:hypothetical protein